MRASGLLKRLFWTKAGPGYVVPGSLVGTFDLGADRIIGEVLDETETRRNAISIHIRRAGKEIMRALAEPLGDTHVHRFELAVQGLFPVAELLSGKTQVLASSGFGHSGTLRLNGATELELVREHLGVPVATLCDIRFTQTGNAASFIGAGWSGPEAQSTWTEDDDSFLTLPAITQPGAHALRLTTGAMVSPPLCNGQNVELYLNETLLWGQYLAESLPQFFEIKFEGEAFLGQPLRVRLHHPDALRLRDFNADGDPRRLALSVRRLSLVRFLP